ncbi:MAG: nucleotidyltransferase family protein [Bacteroidetes bacterium]|nr:nucleotidyltransferase family protein [Bacteroidota bacterium]
MERVEAIILAGGLGTRLRGVIGADTPKCMAPVAGIPFLDYLLRYAARQGITHIMLSLGHKSEAVTDWLSSRHFPMNIDWVIEPEPLGTGGGIRLALQACQARQVFVLNGDTFFDIPLSAGLLQAHQHSGAETTIALKALKQFERYGTVEADDRGIITAFQEKKACLAGRINGGIYCIHRTAFLNRDFPVRFSFEKDYLGQHVAEGIFQAFESKGYFIDIGVPEDYERAQQDFPQLFSPA